MSRIATPAAPAARTNRRFILLAVSLGLLGAILVYVAFSRDSTESNVGTTGNPGIPVVVARADIPPRTLITPAMLDVRLVPEETRSVLAFGEPAQVAGQVTRFPIAANEQVLSTKVVSLALPNTAGSRSLSYVVPEGKRGFAINASEIQNVGGLLLPGDYVDVMVLYDVNFGDTAATAYVVQTIFQNIEVLAVAQAVVDVVLEGEETTPANGQRVRNTEYPPAPSAQTITLLLTPDQVQRMWLAEANGSIRLSMRAFGDGEQSPIEILTKNDLYPPNLPRPVAR